MKSRRRRRLRIFERFYTFVSLRGRSVDEENCTYVSWAASGTDDHRSRISSHAASPFSLSPDFDILAAES
jgi:hypothetical protein